MKRGTTMMIGGALILHASMPVLHIGTHQFAYSVIGAMATAGALTVFHKPRRYTSH